ncbi:hypothetical protein ACFY3G_49125 [Streptomyces phaeochromogenes]|uniref:hypothetical protein n=1 Tax=Streptomyces phaeochromogenes TaxID=1923 RepID=UPI0036879FCE
MTTTPRSPRLLLLSAVVLAVLGIALLGMPHGQEQSAPEPSSTAPADPSSAASSPPRRQGDRQDGSLYGADGIDAVGPGVRAAAAW